MVGKPTQKNDMPSLDTNCLLRWLLGDIPKQAEIVAALIDSEENIVVADVALVETIFVLEKLKKINREAIGKAILVIFGKDTIQCNRELFLEVLPVYINNPSLSFVDCYLEVLARRTGAVPLFTFDKKLANQLSDAKILS